MNKQIQDLMGKTLDKHFSHTWSTMNYDDVTKFAEKFAELIVQECSAYVEGTGNWLVAMEMKQHFGVEE